MHNGEQRLRYCRGNANSWRRLDKYLTMLLCEFLDDITYKFVADIEGDKNRGWQVDEVKAFYDEKEVGYLKISYIPKERFERQYRSIFDYLYKIEGKHLLPRGVDPKKVTAAELRPYLFALQYEAEGWADGDWQKANERWTDQEVMTYFYEVERVIYKHNEKRFKEFREFHVDKPLVDFIRVQPEYQRKGVASLLYKLGAKWMASRGMKLFASGLQSDQAKAAWSKLSVDGKVKVHRGRYGGKRMQRRFYAVDKR